MTSFGGVMSSVLVDFGLREWVHSFYASGAAVDITVITQTSTGVICVEVERWQLTIGSWIGQPMLIELRGKWFTGR